MTRWKIRRSRFGWWVAFRPDEPLGLVDSHTYYRAFTRERLLRKLKRKMRAWSSPTPWEEIELLQPESRSYRTADPTWPAERAMLEADAMREVYEQGHAGEGTCLICNRPMSQHPPERVLSSDPRLCPSDSDG